MEVERPTCFLEACDMVQWATGSRFTYYMAGHFSNFFEVNARLPDGEMYVFQPTEHDAGIVRPPKGWITPKWISADGTVQCTMGNVFPKVKRLIEQKEDILP